MLYGKFIYKKYLLSILKYKTLGARALVIKDNKVMLIKHTYQDGWYTVGGGVEKGETFKEAALRELREEVGIVNVKDIKLFNVYYNNFEKRDDYIAFYIVKDFEIQASNSPEISKVQWFSLNELPEGITPATLLRINEYLGKIESSERWKH